MQTKLTLRLEEAVIEAAKQYAEARGTSVSRLVSSYLAALTRVEDPPADDVTITTDTPVQVCFNP